MFTLRSIGGAGSDLELRQQVSVCSGDKAAAPRQMTAQRGDVFLRYKGVEYSSTQQKHAGDRFIGYDRHMALGIDAEPITVTDVLKGIFSFFGGSK